MKKTVALLALGSTLLLAGPALSATVTISASGAGVYDIPLGGGTATFESAVPVIYPTTAPSPGTFGDGGATFNVAPNSNGIVAKYSDGLSSGLYAPPAGAASASNNQYFSVIGSIGGSSKVTFGGQFTQLGLFWGSIDAFNSIEFYTGGNLVDIQFANDQVTGSDVTSPANGNQVSLNTNRYILLTLAGSTFDSIILRSSGNSFELDNLAWGPAQAPGDVPVPLALPLFAAGLGVVGLMSRRRRKVVAA